MRTRTKRILWTSSGAAAAFVIVSVLAVGRPVQLPATVPTNSFSGDLTAAGTISAAAFDGGTGNLASLGVRGNVTSAGVISGQFDGGAARFQALNVAGAGTVFGAARPFTSKLYGGGHLQVGYDGGCTNPPQANVYVTVDRSSSVLP